MIANSAVYFTSWWGEGEVKVFLDGDTAHPTLCGTGTSAQMHGTGLELCLGKQPVDLKNAVAAKGYGLFQRQDDWSSCAYFYLDRPENGLPALPPAATRAAGL